MEKTFALIVLFCSWATPAYARLLDTSNELFYVNVQDVDDEPREQRRHHSFRCAYEGDERICLVGATLDGNRLDMTTYCPINSADVADCTCDVTYRNRQCNSCSYCQETDVFIVDCSNVINNRRCSSVDCNGICLDWGGGSSSSSFRDGSRGNQIRLSRESVAAIAVFATMCCLPCLTAMLCARLLPRNDSRSQQDGPSGGTSFFNGTDEDRKDIIEACLKTEKVLDGDDPKEKENDALDSSPSSGTIDTDSTSTDEESEQTEQNKEEATGVEPEEASEASETGEQSPDIMDSNSTSLDAEQESDDEDHELCQICLEPFRTGDERSWSQVSKCSHSFHKDCITAWLQRHEDCPCCRAKFLSFDGVPEEDEDCDV